MSLVCLDLFLPPQKGIGLSDFFPQGNILFLNSAGRKVRKHSAPRLSLNTCLDFPVKNDIPKIECQKRDPQTLPPTHQTLKVFARPIDKSDFPRFAHRGHPCSLICRPSECSCWKPPPTAFLFFPLQHLSAPTPFPVESLPDPVRFPPVSTFSLPALHFFGSMDSTYGSNS